MIINGFNIELCRKNIKNINLKVYPSLKIKVSAPLNMEMTTIKRVIISKEMWIRSKLQFYEEQKRLTKRNYISGEDCYFNGKRYILKVIDSNTPSVVKGKSNTIVMYVRKSSSLENKERLLNSFYKEELQKKLNKFIPELENQIGVKCLSFDIRKMKNKWGNCNYNNKTILFNIDLAKKKDSEIKYVIIHELVHLIEKTHNEHFYELVNTYCPKWEIYDDSLNLILNENKK